ncbi:MAG: HDOD domain-containing protein [Rhodocyclales bacterium]|nr:HDOD domain-containing protein [Rhodocyclales bacterium]
MLKSLLARLRGARPVAAPDTRKEFDDLNRKAPLRGEAGAQAHAETPGADTFLCREAVLGRDQRIAGYQFMLREGTRGRIRNSSRVVHHVYAEVLVRNLLQSNIGGLLGHRHAYLDLPDSFLAHPCLRDLPPANTVLVIEHLGGSGAPAPETLLEQVRDLRAEGFRIAIPDPDIVTELAHLLPEVDAVVLRALAIDPERNRQRKVKLAQLSGHTDMLVRELTTMEHLGLCMNLGVALFQGPFVTSREDWHDNKLRPDVARLAILLGRLRQDADTAEIVTLTKQNPALSLRLLRYINSAASGLPTKVASIEGALQLLGRDKLYRWLMIMFCSTNEAHGRSAAALESALVRARMMELLAAKSAPTQQEALFLTGLLSLADVVLQVPLERAIAPLGLSAEIEDAILRRSGPHAALLELVIACETAQAEQIDSAAQRCGITPASASTRHIEALGWALGTLL